MSVASVITQHENSGRYFEAGGVKSFALDQGEGEPVVCMHGVPASSFLYRKVVPELAARGMRGIAFDLPGLGLADRPDDFDYSWTGLGQFAAAAVDSLGLERFHLVVHDVGGPVGFELAAALPERIASITVLNTLVEVDTFRRPWSMEPFAHRGIGEAYLRSLNKPLFRLLMRMQGVADMSQVSKDEFGAYVDLLRRGDRGRAFLKIMRGFELTREKRNLYVDVMGVAGIRCRSCGARTTPRSRSPSVASRPARRRGSSILDFPASTSSRRNRRRPSPTKSRRSPAPIRRSSAGGVGVDLGEKIALGRLFGERCSYGRP